MSMQSVIGFGSSDVVLEAAPICSDWILEGEPIARNKLLSGSADGGAFTLVWDCTAGMFNWYYNIDETVYVIEGSVVVRDENGVERRLDPGDTAFFPAGSHAVWRVDTYIRKVAFCRNPLPTQLKFFVSVLRGMHRAMSVVRKKEAPLSMFRAAS